MSNEQKEEEIKQKEEINLLNTLKDEEYLKKLTENSHLDKDLILLDSNLSSNKDINSALSNEWNTAKFPNFVADLTAQSKSSFPIDNFLNNQSEDNIFYQHPNLLNQEENDLVILNSFRDLEVDLMNKWFENSEFLQYYQSLFHQELFLNQERKLECIDKLKEKIKNNLEKEIKLISSNQSFKFNLILLKFSLKELSNVSLDNIDDLSMNISNFENYSKFLDEHFEISFLLTKEINDLLKKINNLIDNLLESNAENKQNNLGKLLIYEYDIVYGLKSLYGFLHFIKKIKSIEKKGMLSDDIRNLLINKIKAPHLSNLIKEKIEKVQNKNEYKAYIKLNNEEFNFNNSNLVYINQDIFYLLNENNTLYKIYKTVDNKNRFNIIETNKNFLNNNQISLFSIGKEYLFGFDSNEFGKGENVIKLLKKEHSVSTVKNTIKMDDLSQKILTMSITNSKEIINDTYLNLFDFNQTEKENFLNIYLPNNEIKDFTIPIIQNNSSLFILHPIYKKISTKAPNNQKEINNYFFSQKYIYAIDEFEIFLSQEKIKEDDENILYINHKNSFIIKTPLDNFNAFDEEEKKKIKEKFDIDQILTNIKNKNKLVIINKYLCFTDSCQKFLNIKNGKICIFEKENKENELLKDISEISSDGTIIASYQNSIFVFELIKSTINNIQELIENEYKVNNIYYKNNIFWRYRNKIVRIQKIINRMIDKSKALNINDKDDIIKEIFQVFEDNDEYLNKEKNEIKEENELKENISNYILSNLFFITNELSNTDEIKNNLMKLKEDEDEDKEEKDNILKITKYLKRPFVINIDFPTIKIIEELISDNLDNNKDSNELEIFIFCLLFILDNHLSHLSALHINSKFLFGNLKNIDYLINLLTKIYEKNKEYKNLCLSLIIKILAITEDYPKEKLSLLFIEILYPVDFMNNPEKLDLYYHFFKYSNYSKQNMKTIISNENSYQFILDIIDSLLKNEKQLNISYISEFFNEFILFYNNLISYIIVHMNEVKLPTFVNTILSLLINNFSEEKINSPKILQPLLYNLTIQCLNNHKLLSKDFYLKNWSYIYDLLYELQKIRSSDFSKKERRRKAWKFSEGVH